MYSKWQIHKPSGKGGKYARFAAKVGVVISSKGKYILVTNPAYDKLGQPHHVTILKNGRLIGLVDSDKIGDDDGYAVADRQREGHNKRVNAVTVLREYGLLDGNDRFFPAYVDDDGVLVFDTAGSVEIIK